MKLNDMKFSEVMALKEQFQGMGMGINEGGSKEQENKYYKIGGKIFIRTVTHIIVGRLIGLTHLEFIIEDASWIADTGRFSTSLKDFNNLDEVEFNTMVMGPAIKRPAAQFRAVVDSQDIGIAAFLGGTLQHLHDA